MGLLRRRSPRGGTPQSLGAEAEWALAKGELDGLPLIARWDAAARRACPDPSRPIKVTVGIQCVDARPDGLPSSEDLTLFEAMEEAMFAELPPLASASPVLVLTTGGMREWIIYSGSHEWLESWAPRFQERFMQGRPGKVEAVSEPGWETFEEWTATTS
jgi:hypothetical protein